MRSRPWKEQLRVATDALCAALGDLYAPRENNVQSDPTVRLARAATDALQVQERVNIALEDALQQEREWRQKAEQRISELELVVRNVNHAAEEIDTGVISRKRKRTHQARVETICEDSFLEEKENIDGNGRESEEEQADDANHNQGVKEGTVQENEIRIEREERESQQQIPEGADHEKDIQDIHKPLIPLPTLQDVERDLLRKRQEKRARDEWKPPPCEKCRLRKRAIMLRKSGYVNEEVFERWAKKPGGCIEYIHADEQVPDDQRSPLSFAETATQSPD